MARQRYLARRSLADARVEMLASAEPITRHEVLAAEEALGRVLARAVSAARNVPHYHGAAMDGIAVRAEDTFGASEGHPLTFELGSPDTVVRPFSWIDTGNNLPLWADSVVMVERVFPGPAAAGSGAAAGTVAARAGDDCCGAAGAAPENAATAGDESGGGAGLVRGPERVLHLRHSQAPWQHVRLVGEDIVQSEPLLPRGHRVRPIDIGALLAAGIDRVDVRARPRVAILPTGDELVQPGNEPRPGRIVEFNSRMIAAFVREWGGDAVRLEPVGDNPEALYSRIVGALRDADVVCVIAGSSAGDHDHSAEALARFGRLIAHGIDIMPGKPAIVAAIEHLPDGPAASSRVALGIPGYPVSAAIVCRELLEPLLAHLLGAARVDRVCVKALVPRKLVSKLGHEEFVRVNVGRVGERLVLSPLGRGAGAITTLTRADGFVRVPPLVEGIDAGEEVAVELLRPIAEIEGTIVASGSHDLTLGVLDDLLRGACPGSRLVTNSVGSLAGLLALGRGEAHVAASHLLDVASGTYNLPDVERLLEGVPVMVVNLVVREQGLLVAAGNPLGIGGVRDLTRAGLRYVNRQSGAGTRVLLDFMLERDGIDPEAIAGHERCELTHMAVAIAVRSGLADAGMGVRSAAAALGLGFVPLEREDYDLVLRADFARSAAGRALLGVVRSAGFAAAVSCLPGYDTRRSGEVKIPCAT